MLELTTNQPSVTLAGECAQTIRYWITRANPRFAEVIFAGVGKNHMIDKIFWPSEDFSPNSGISNYNGELCAAADTQELDILLKQIKDQGRLADLMLLGHSHPPFSIYIFSEGAKYELSTNHWLYRKYARQYLYPSTPDIMTIRTCADQNQLLLATYFAIAADPGNRPTLRVYKRTTLLKQQDIQKVKFQDIQL